MRFERLAERFCSEELDSPYIPVDLGIRICSRNLNPSIACTWA